MTAFKQVLAYDRLFVITFLVLGVMSSYLNPRQLGFHISSSEVDFQNDDVDF